MGSCFSCCNRTFKKCCRCCSRSFPANNDQNACPLNDNQSEPPDHEIEELLTVEVTSILDPELWTDLNGDDKPLFQLNVSQFWANIGRWIQNDVDYNHKSTELKRLFQEYGVSGAAVCIIYVEQKSGGTLIETILRKEMSRYLSADTLEITIKSWTEWLCTVDVVTLRDAPSDDIAQLIMEFPIRNLKKALFDEQMDGKSFIENAEEFEFIVQESTGWKKSECVLLSEVMLRRMSFTKQQILKNIERLAHDTDGQVHGQMTQFPQSLISKLKRTFRSKGNLENVHYRLRVHAVIDDVFRDLVQDVLNDLLNSKELIGIEVEFIPIFFDTISNAMIMPTEDGKGQLPWRCPCCGNLNVHKVVAYQMVTDISSCSLCGVTQTEAIIMALKGVPMPFQIQQPVADEEHYDVDEMWIFEKAKNRRCDLHCPTQKDGNLCPKLMQIAKLLMEKRRLFLLLTVRDMNADDLRHYVMTKEYKDILLDITKDILSEKAKETIEVIHQRVEDDMDGICDFPKYFRSKENRKKFIGILKKDKVMNGGAAGKIYKKVRLELARKVFMAKVHGLDLKQLRHHVQHYHLDSTSVPKKRSLRSFFHNVVHSEDVIGVIEDCRQRKQLSKEGQYHKNYDLKQLTELDDLYMLLCHQMDNTVFWIPSFLEVT